MSHRTMYQSFQASLLVLLMGSCALANAALFEDADARRAILDLRQKLEVSQQLNKSQSEEISVLRKALLELQNQIDGLKAEQSSIRGGNEQVLRAVSDIQLKQKDILQELNTLLAKVDARFSKLEPIKVVLDGLEFQADPAEKRDFDAALAVFRTADFAAAQISLLNFLRKYPTSGYASSSLFWLGNAQYATKDYKESIVNFRKLLSIAPEHSRAPEAMLAISNCLVELKDLKAAKKAMEDLVKAYPTTEAAQTAKDRLARLR
jgi:tol-pal system protein YbgF